MKISKFNFLQVIGFTIGLTLNYQLTLPGLLPPLLLRLGDWYEIVFCYCCCQTSSRARCQCLVGRARAPVILIVVIQHLVVGRNFVIVRHLQHRFRLHGRFVVQHISI